MDKIRNEYIRGTAQVRRFGEKTREARLRWYGHVLRKDDGYIGRKMLRMDLPGKRKRGRPKRRFMDVVKEDMAEVEVTEEDTEDRSNWRWKMHCGDPWWEKAERRRRRSSICYELFHLSDRIPCLYILFNSLPQNITLKKITNIDLIMHYQEAFS